MLLLVARCRLSLAVLFGEALQPSAPLLFFPGLCRLEVLSLFFKKIIGHDWGGYSL